MKEFKCGTISIIGKPNTGKSTLINALTGVKISAVSDKPNTTRNKILGVYNSENSQIIFLDTPGLQKSSKFLNRIMVQSSYQAIGESDIVLVLIDGSKKSTINTEDIASKIVNKKPIIAINKIDLPNIDTDKVRQDLLSHEIIVEKLSGDVLDVEVSALKKINLDKLKESILLQADLLNLSANPNRAARGSIIESKLEKGRGSVATVLVQKGTLKVSDIFVSGSEWGKVKALVDDKGNNIKEAKPSTPVEVLGFDSNPLAGDDFIVVESEAVARKIAEYRFSKLQKQKNKVVKSNVEEMFEQINQGKALSLIHI